MNHRSWAWLPCAALFTCLAGAMFVLVLASLSPSPLGATPPPGTKPIDPTAWGSDHVDQPVPEYMDGGECLFCHRDDVGPTWPRNRHNRTVREPEAGDAALAALAANASTKELADEVKLVMGDKRAVRFLKKAAAYGKADMVSVTAVLDRNGKVKLEGVDNPHWDDATFAKACAGCHATAVDPERSAFVAVALDCYACHGEVTAEHANDTKQVMFAKARKDSAAVVTSICASCHVRFGKSKATGLPYPTNFVAGDNLFKDFEVDWAKADDPEVNVIDRHVLDNVRDVALYGIEKQTCLTCHNVHSGHSKAHRDLPVDASCLLCHEPGDPIKGFKPYEIHSERCGY